MSNPEHEFNRIIDTLMKENNISQDTLSQHYSYILENLNVLPDSNSNQLLNAITKEVMSKNLPNDKKIEFLQPILIKMIQKVKTPSIKDSWTNMFSLLVQKTASPPLIVTFSQAASEYLNREFPQNDLAIAIYNGLFRFGWYPSLSELNSIQKSPIIYKAILKALIFSLCNQPPRIRDSLLNEIVSSPDVPLNYAAYLDAVLDYFQTNELPDILLTPLQKILTSPLGEPEITCILRYYPQVLNLHIFTSKDIVDIILQHASTVLVTANAKMLKSFYEYIYSRVDVDTVLHFFEKLSNFLPSLCFSISTYLLEKSQSPIVLQTVFKFLHKAESFSYIKLWCATYPYTQSYLQPDLQEQLAYLLCQNIINEVKFGHISLQDNRKMIMQAKSKNPICFSGWRELSDMIKALSTTSSLQFLQNQGIPCIQLALTKHQIPLIPSIVKFLVRFSQMPHIIESFFLNLSLKSNAYGKITIIKMITQFFEQKVAWDTLSIPLISHLFAFISSVKTSENVKVCIVQSLSVFTKIYQQTQNPQLLVEIRKIIDTVYNQLNNSSFNPKAKKVYREPIQTKQLVTEVMSLLDNLKSFIEPLDDIVPIEEPFLAKPVTNKVNSSNSWLPISTFHSFSPPTLSIRQRLNKRPSPIKRYSNPHPNVIIAQPSSPIIFNNL